VLVAKAAAALARRPAQPQPPTPPAPPTARPLLDSPPRALSALTLPLLGLLVAAALAYAWLDPSRPTSRRRPIAPFPAGTEGSGSRAPLASPATAPPDGVPPEIMAPRATRPLPLPPTDAFGGGDDGRAASALGRKLASGAPLDSADISTAERLDAAYPRVGRRLLVSVLAAAAGQERASRRYDEAGRLLERVVALEPGASEPRQGLLALRIEQGDWPAVEAVARELQRHGVWDSTTVNALAYSLVRQDRVAEAVEILTRYLERQSDPTAAALLDRLRRDSAAETALRQQTLSHFHVRYDGEAHEDVGRELLRVLDRHYATLARTFDHEPAAPIPVVLLSREAYYDGTGAPAWSGGRYDSFDGRVRIPIGGLTTSLTRDLDDTALHELTHAFVADRSRELAPRELQEGLAQMMEGKRLSSLPDETLRALANGRLGGVGGFYLMSLAFTEDLVAQRGQGGINDVLSAMARTGNVDAAFREVYGRDYQATGAEALVRLRSRYGR
jgi:hypothetical protein